MVEWDQGMWNRTWHHILFMTQWVSDFSQTRANCMATADRWVPDSVKSEKVVPGPVVLVMFAGLVAGCAERPAGEAAYPRVYEYTYEHNTPTLNENHYIVLDSTGGSIRGWYFGTSDDFDSAREGYLPGFFVAEMEDLRVARDTISFTLRPRKLFASPVPLHYRDAAVIPADSLPEWTGPPLASMKSYSGTATSDRISLEMGTGERLFQRVTRRM